MLRAESIAFRHIFNSNSSSTVINIVRTIMAIMVVMEVEIKVQIRVDIKAEASDQEEIKVNQVVII